MNKKLSLSFALVLLSIFSLTFVFAQGLGVPHQFYGNTIYNGVGANGLTIDAYIDGTKVGNTTTLNGKYGYSPIFLIKDPESEYSGKTIKFYLNGIDTGITYIFENGASTKLDLSATGTTPTPPSNGGSSPSGGSSGSSGSSSSSSTKNTTSTTQTQITTQTTTPPETEGEEQTPPTPEIKGFFSGITGAVTGIVGTPAGIGVLIFIIAIVAVYIYVVVMRKKAK